MSAARSRKTFYGWRVVAAVFVLATFGWGLGFYGPPVYLHTVQVARGWSLALISAAVTTHYLFGALVVANLPKLYKRFGVSAVTKAGCVALAAGIFGWAMAEQPWQLFLATLFSGGGWATTGPAAVNAIISPWFVRSRAAALASAYNGATAGGVIFSPLWVAAIGLLGFPGAALAIGLVVIAIIWVLADLCYAKTPDQMGLLPDGDVFGGTAVSVTSPRAVPLPGKRLWRDRRFLTLATGMTLGLFAQIGLLAHLFSLLVPALGAQLAGVAAGAATASAITGRTLFGWLMPIGTDRRLFACASYVIQIAGSLAFLLAAGNDVPMLLLGVVLFGFGIGNATSLPPLIAQVEFVKDDVARVVPLIVAISQGTYAFAPTMFGIIREFTQPGGTVTSGVAPYLFAAAAAIQGAAIAAFMLGRVRIGERKGKVAPEIDTSILAETKLSERWLCGLRRSGAAATLAVDDCVSNSEEQTMTEYASNKMTIADAVSGEGLLVVAQWEANEGQADNVADILDRFLPEAQSEPGVKLFLIGRNKNNPAQFLFYELFRDEAAFKAHQESLHFKTYIAGQALRLLAKRERAQYALL